MVLCFKPFLAAVPRHRWFSDNSAVDMIPKFLLRPQNDGNIHKLSNLAGRSITAHHMCRHGEYSDERHPVVLACRKWHTCH
eukprot:5128338-Amphidinium_carterae.1